MAEPPIRDQAVAFFEREEHGRTAPFGRVLDLGCGSGFWAVMLAQRGWDVTGVDFVGKALRRADHRALRAGVGLRTVTGDVTKLSEMDLGHDFSLLLDFGLFHDELSDEQRVAMGRAVTAIAAPDATLLLMAWARGRRGPLPRGANRADIEAAFPRWTVVEEEPMDVSNAPRSVRKASPRFYRLRHHSTEASTSRYPHILDPKEEHHGTR